jgi:hypothetical protein
VSALPREAVRAHQRQAADVVEGIALAPSVAEGVLLHQAPHVVHGACWPDDEQREGVQITVAKPSCGSGPLP